eukprot:354921-Chlamydomonas_euryale.AAC.13
MDGFARVRSAMNAPWSWRGITEAGAHSQCNVHKHNMRELDISLNNAFQLQRPAAASPTQSLATDLCAHGQAHHAWLTFTIA